QSARLTFAELRVPAAMRAWVGTHTRYTSSGSSVVSSRARTRAGVERRVPLAVTAWGRTRLTLSFGSCGSFGGPFSASAAGVERGRAVGEERNAVALVGRSDGEHVREACGHEAAAAGLTVVADRRDHNRAPVQGTVDRLLQQRVVAEEAATDVDHASRAFGRGIEPGEKLGEGSFVEVPFLQGRLRIDADEADAVGGGTDNRTHRRSVEIVHGDDGLGVERSRVRPRLELGMGEIEARIDDGDGYARRRRLGLVVADVVDPPFLRQERVARAEMRERDEPSVAL